VSAQVDGDQLPGAPVGEEQPIVVPPGRLDEQPILKQHSESGHAP
jgi:hypothetical protein